MYFTALLFCLTTGVTAYSQDLTYKTYDYKIAPATERCNNLPAIDTERASMPAVSRLQVAQAALLETNNQTHLTLTMCFCT